MKTALVVYRGPAAAVQFLTDDDDIVTAPRGEPVPVPAALADRLCEQDTWEPATPKTARSRATSAGDAGKES